MPERPWYGSSPSDQMRAIPVIAVTATGAVQSGPTNADGTPGGTTTATKLGPTTLGSAGAPTLVLPANPNRKGYVVAFSGVGYLGLGFPCDNANNWTYRLNGNTSFEEPAARNFKGDVYACGNAASVVVTVTEFT